MITFFRKIRFDLMKKNLPNRQTSNTARYLKYGLGEILLVMIGILLALQVNNFNQDRKDNKKEQQILSQLKIDFTANLAQLEQKIANRMKIIGAANRIFDYIDAGNVNEDSLYSRLSVFIGAPTFKPIENNLINSGNILLIKNQKLNRLLTAWPSEVFTIKEIEKIWHQQVWEMVIPFFADIGVSRETFSRWWNDDQNLQWILEGNSKNPFQIPKSNSTLKPNEILKKKELEGFTTVALSVNSAVNLQSQIISKRILEIMDLLNQEIK
jgi:Family of unknown function (DUF6090)